MAWSALEDPRGNSARKASTTIGSPFKVPIAITLEQQRVRRLEIVAKPPQCSFCPIGIVEGHDRPAIFVMSVFVG